MILKDVLKEGVNFLKSSGNEAPAFEAGVILCHVLKCRKVFLYTHDDYNLNEKEYREYIEAVRKRANGEPLQYITGHQEFMSLDFKVTPDVLIPRQDTEILVESVLEYAKDEKVTKYINVKDSKDIEDTKHIESTKNTKDSSIDILDIGTGSGCIAVSLAHYIKNSRIVAVDISQKALDVAKYNAQKNNVADRIEFICGDIFTGLKNIFRGGKKKFDVIVSNPPYIASHEIPYLEKQVKDFEPLKALDGGDDGLDFYRFIVKEGVNFLKREGLLALEVGINQAWDVLKMMGEKYLNIKVVKDLSGIERVVMGFFRY
ncbi:peptide chain release factor N(5)-glutamine methyltransferase [Acetivibrio saccincola]|uniref:Release factor glutamine methyltransferase n=1 Tax=Acetivibrio saccincola TaxID=1677857 RepID=A0A2K9E4B3_9FIRM|nr:peptide chain release factor N(5)-glutamine methyltransferase [Acetivibrio saccincola]AUG56306.1 Release factor glutamine methyltransferase [Acetivibrio saccincola]